MCQACQCICIVCVFAAVMSFLTLLDFLPYSTAKKIEGRAPPSLLARPSACPPAFPSVRPSVVSMNPMQGPRYCRIFWFQALPHFLVSGTASFSGPRYRLIFWSQVLPHAVSQILPHAGSKKVKKEKWVQTGPGMDHLA